LREALDAMLPHDLDAWMLRAHELRRSWRERRIPMEARRPELLDALNALYAGRRPAGDPAALDATPGAERPLEAAK
jgi:hypothetical protein